MSLCRAGARCPSTGNSGWLPCCCLTFWEFYDTSYPKCNVCWIALLMPGTWQQMGLEIAEVKQGLGERGWGLWGVQGGKGSRAGLSCWALLCCSTSGSWEGAWRGTGTALMLGKWLWGTRMERGVNAAFALLGWNWNLIKLGQSWTVGEAPPLEEPHLPIQQPLVVPVWKTEVWAHGLWHQGSCRTGWQCLLSPVTVTSDGVAAQPHCLAAGVIQELSADFVLEVKSCPGSQSWSGHGRDSPAHPVLLEQVLVGLWAFSSGREQSQSSCSQLSNRTRRAWCFSIAPASHGILPSTLSALCPPTPQTFFVGS